MSCSLLALAAACSSPGHLEFLRGRVVTVDADPAGGAWLTLELSARNYRIDPELSPDPAALVAFARDAVTGDSAVYLTAWDRDELPKSPANLGSGLPPIVLRLAVDPDPRTVR